LFIKITDFLGGTHLFQLFNKYINPYPIIICMETIIISLGGSIIAPDKPDYFFLSEFKNFIIKYLPKYRFVIVCGGGKTNSYYNDAAKRVSMPSKDDLDMIGIMATRLNAELVRVIFGNLAYEKVIYDPEKKIKTKKNIIVAAGWKPGRSTDFVAVAIAKQLQAKEILNLTNIDYIYDKDPRKFKNAKKKYSLTWDEYKKIVGNKWQPRLSSPFDPIASKEAKKQKLKVVILKGTDLKNVERFFCNLSLEGSVIYK
jgi:uridylate kinase